MTNETENKKAHIIVISNEKGGTGKSTISMHLAIKLMQEGFSVATFDLDGRQGSLSKYIDNRRKYCEAQNISLPIPIHTRIYPEENPYLHAQARDSIASQILQKKNSVDAIIIDTPGTKNYLFEEAHKYADTVITPISDSLIDLNVIADIDYKTDRILKPGHYSNFIWDIKKYLASQGKPYLNWIITGNKLSSFNSKNKATVFEHLQRLSKIYGFRLFSGFKDRVIYKELFLEGLTVLDMKDEALKMKMTVSHIAAKREINALAEFISPE